MIWIILLVLALVLLWKWVDDENPLDQLPGPPRLPIVGCCFSFIGMTQREIFSKMKSFYNEFGNRYMVKVFKRRILHIHTPEDIEVVLSHGKNIKKNKPYRFLEPWLGTGLLISTGSKWHNRRKVLTPAFHFNVLKSFAEVIEEKSRNFVELLKEHQGEEIELGPVVSDFTLYTICETAMGTQLDSNKTSAKVEYKKAILEIGKLFLKRITTIWLHVDEIFKRSEPGKQFNDCVKKVHTFADTVIIERKKHMELNRSSDFREVGIKNRLAFLDLLLEAEHRGEIDLEGIREEVNTFMFEGHDTTALAITFGLMLLADHEEIQDKIHEEYERVMSGSDRRMTTSDLAEMKYLDAVIKEILRLYPSVPLVGRQITEDFKLGDLLVKAGSEVIVHILDLHRSPELYPEPEMFKPERFLESRPKHPFAFIPFSAGPRNCIGQRFAMLEMKYVFADLCRSFKLSPKMKAFRPALIVDIVLRSDEPVYITFNSR